MELRHIRYLLAVAEEGNFTRAAERLGIGQPPLSQQIRDLEREVGTALLHRLPRGAEPTEAGRAFLEIAGPLPARAAEAARAAGRAAAGETGRLSIGFAGTAALNPIVATSVRVFRRKYPNVELSMEEENSRALAAGVAEGRLDAAVVRLSEPAPEEVKTWKLVDEPLLVALPAAHPAAAEAGRVDLRTLRDEPVILAPLGTATGLRASVVQAYRDAGLEPRPGPSAPQIVSILALVSAELGISLVPEATRKFHIEGVVFREIVPPVPLVSLAVAHRADNPLPAAVNFRDIARTIAREGGG